MWWEQDETVYLSQVAAHSPALRFTPPRARGMAVLLYPVVHFTTRVTIVRAYVAVVGTAAMYLGFRPWLRLGLGRLVALAALLFSTLWATTFFGAETQPNFMVAALSLATVGYALLAVRAPVTGWRFVPVVVAVALLALVRPSDATWLSIGLLAAFALWRAVALRRRVMVAAALVGGLALGWSQWVIEAFTSYGGLLHRLHSANAENTPGIHFSLLTQASAVNGPTLCRPCGQPITAPHVAWLVLIPPLVAIGLIAARGTRRFFPLVAATVGGTAVLAEYVFTVSYAAPRFLLPVYALYALPCAAGAAALVRWRPVPQVRWVMPALLLVVLFVQVASQTGFLRALVHRYSVNRARYVAEAKALRVDGVRQPCLMNGALAAPVAFALRCNDQPTVQPGEPVHVAPGTMVVEFALPGTYPPGRSAEFPLLHTVRGRVQVAYIFPGGPSTVPKPLIAPSLQPHR
jgi:hypothetical protein